MSLCTYCASKTPKNDLIASLVALNDKLSSIDSGAIIPIAPHLNATVYKNQKEWLGGRYGISGSKMSSICGRNFFQSARSVAYDAVMTKLGRSRPKVYDSVKQSHLDRGHALEPLAADLYAKVSGHDYVPLSPHVIFCNPLIFDASLSCTPDRITYCGLILEIKCPSKKPIPANVRYYTDQIQSYLHTFDVEEAVLMQYCSDQVYCVSSGIKKSVKWYEDDAYLAVEQYNRLCRQMEIMLAHHHQQQPSPSPSTTLDDETNPAPYPLPPDDDGCFQ